MSECKSTQIIDEQGIDRALTRIVHEILERVPIQKLAIIGVHTRGAFLAKRLTAKIKEIEKKEIPLGLLDITLYRDDLSEIGAQPTVQGTEISFDVQGKVIVLIDDVLFTGRTIRCALDAIVDYGRPAGIQLAVLIDRGHRELPIKADYVGKNIPTSLDQKVHLHLQETDDEDAVLLEEKA